MQKSENVVGAPTNHGGTNLTMAQKTFFAENFKPSHHQISPVHATATSIIMFTNVRNSLFSLFRAGMSLYVCCQLFSFFFSQLTFLAPAQTQLKSSLRFKHEYAPRFTNPGKKHKGRVPVRIGGSIKGSTLQFGQYGLRLKSDGVRLAAIQLKEADNWLMRTVRPSGGKLIRRLQTNIAVCTKGNETRMGKGKGPFDYWAVRVPTGKILFEINAPTLHEKVARDAFRIAADKLPGIYEFVTLNSLPKAGFDRVTAVKPTENAVEKMKANPDRKLANALKGNDEFYKLYRR